MEDEITTDLEKFGYRELEEAVRLLTAFREQRQRTYFMGNGIKLYFNKLSGNVFLADEDSNVAMMNGDKLEQWFICPECGYEGFKEDMKHKGNKACKEYLKSIGVR
ncbi:MAG: hypothetical protein QW478_04735 [Candidatus Micrarchaeaceae archaeon]